MRFLMLLALLTCALLLPLHAAAAPPAVTGTTAVSVRVYNAGRLDATTLRRALAEAEPSLSSADVDVSWVVCDQAARCSHPLKPGELAVRVVRPGRPANQPGTHAAAPRPAYRGSLPLGDALIDPAGGVLATVYVDRVEWLARTADISVTTLLGRAIAHEIGHLLLGTAAHARDGVMRAVWSPEALRHSPSGDWRFTPRDAEALREAARRRSAQPLHTW